MFKYILRNMWRRKTRTILTISGIVVGIFALTVLGGLSARLTQQVNGAKVWFSRQINVVPAGESLFGGAGRYLEISKVAEIEKVPGVKVAVAGIGFPRENGGGFFGPPDLIIGYDLSRSERSAELLELLQIRDGRNLGEGDQGKVALGATVAKKLDARVGGMVTLKGRLFQVVGIYQPTLSTADSFAFIEYQDALDLFRAENPYFQIRDIAGSINVLPEPGVDLEELAARIEEQVEGVKAISPKEAEAQISQFSLIFNSILLGIAFVALLVGGLSIINTMVMSVSERIYEIGLKKAIGAETRSILFEYLVESAMIGFLGGAIGMLLGLLAIFILNRLTQANQVTVFAVTTTVVVGPVIFSVILGTLAGILPARRAAGLKPVEALKGD